LAVCGEPAVGRALVLLLRGSGYDARFLPASSLDASGALASVRLLLLAPGLGSSRRGALSKVLENVSDGTAKMPVLRLVASPEEARERGEAPERVVLWPCSTEELKRRIEAALLAHL